jgi:hypothetical protein
MVYFAQEMMTANLISFWRNFAKKNSLCKLNVATTFSQSVVMLNAVMLSVVAPVTGDWMVNILSQNQSVSLNGSDLLSPTKFVQLWLHSQNFLF